MNTQIYDEASQWVVTHRSDDLDAGARRRFDAWLRESPQHVRAYLEMSSIWEGVPALNSGRNPDAKDLIANARAQSNVFPLVESLGRQETPTASVRKARLTSPWNTSGYFFPLAITLLLTLGIASWLYGQRRVYSTGIGEQRTIALADGSTMELNARIANQSPLY